MSVDRVIRVIPSDLPSPMEKVAEKIIYAINREATGTLLGITRITRFFAGVSVVVQTSAQLLMAGKEQGALIWSGSLLGTSNSGSCDARENSSGWTCGEVKFQGEVKL